MPMTVARLSISNLAWEPAHDSQVAAILHSHDLRSIDVAPGRYFESPARADPEQIDAVRGAWARSGIQIIGLQSLMFGTQGLNLFGPAEVRNEMLAHLEGVCQTAVGLGARCLTFGSPRNRDADGWPPEAARDCACDFFTRLAAVAERHDVCICLEPNPPRYHCNFMTTTAEAADVVRAVGRNGIRLQLDTGTLAENHEDAEGIVASCADIIGHVHASEPGLAPLGSGRTDHHGYGRIIASLAAPLTVTVEMLPGEDRIAAVRGSIAVALGAYSPRILASGA
jgi:sugar phosphate isomerase/epimerase